MCFFQISKITLRNVNEKVNQQILRPLESTPFFEPYVKYQKSLELVGLKVDIGSRGREGLIWGPICMKLYFARFTWYTRTKWWS